ncbi:enoyl-CoA hydratase/isomerase family protein [Oceanobacillus rekensis]|uniref:enoyl-CoA hydratase/isomerase family protein n=1 Tax=Oceanobacillus rekensis TaxID=937927 RepID=UPI000B431481|nr:enoyl-CoA hydratase-related protein [Oceanobacillus rekensis]
MEQSNYVEAVIESGIYWLTLNRIEARNALDSNMLDEIERAFGEAEKNQDVKVIVVQGAGGKSFAAGADIKQLNAKKPLEALVPGMQGLYRRVENCNKVTIAAVDGYALGGGCELALACDIRMATNHAKFGLPELNLGIIPGAGGTQRLSRVIGKGRALDMILTGKIIDGEEAERIGLVTYYVQREKLKDKIDEVSGHILKKGPIAIQLAKHAVNKGYDLDIETALWIEKLSQAVAFGTDDKQEGTAAFIEKRQAEFQNK